MDPENYIIEIFISARTPGFVANELERARLNLAHLFFCHPGNIILSEIGAEPGLTRFKFAFNAALNVFERERISARDARFMNTIKTCVASALPDIAFCGEEIKITGIPRGREDELVALRKAHAALKSELTTLRENVAMTVELATLKAHCALEFGKLHGENACLRSRVAYLEDICRQAGLHIN